MSDDIKLLKDLEKDQAEAKQEAEEGDFCGWNMAWIPGLVLMGLGGIFLLNNFTDFQLDNWWALFLLFPAFACLGNFFRATRADGRLSHAARGPLMGSLVLFFLSAIFLFELDWGMVWPVFLIIGGVGALLSGLFD
jgi:hypothetical protein